MTQKYSLKCTKCAAPLTLLGGGRIESVTCSYCKSVLDLNDNYKVLSNFRNVKALHQLPFELGMKGTLKEVEYTIIGRITYTETEFPHKEWSDFLLFSPFYGYAWLTYEEGNLLYSKRNRTFPNLGWNEIANQSVVVVDGEDYEPYDYYKAKITYVEGELTWVAKRNDEIAYVDLIAPPFGISVENSKHEMEHYKTEFMDSKVIYDAFDVPHDKRESTDAFHPLRPFDRPWLKAFSLVAFWTLMVVVLLFIGMLFDGSGKNLTYFSVDNRKSVQEVFTLNSNRYLSTIKLKAPNKKSLNNFNIKLIKDTHLLFTLNQSNAYIFDFETEKIKKKLNSWDKDAKEAMVYLNLQKTGVYQISITPVDRNLSSSLLVNIEEKTMRMNYIVWFMIFLLVSWAIYKIFSWRYAHKLDDERGLYLSYADAQRETAWGNFSMWIFIAVLVIIISSINS